MKKSYYSTSKNYIRGKKLFKLLEMLLKCSKIIISLTSSQLVVPESGDFGNCEAHGMKL